MVFMEFTKYQMWFSILMVGSPQVQLPTLFLAVWMKIKCSIIYLYISLFILFPQHPVPLEESVLLKLVITALGPGPDPSKLTILWTISRNWGQFPAVSPQFCPSHDIFWNIFLSPHHDLWHKNAHYKENKSCWQN